MAETRDILRSLCEAVFPTRCGGCDLPGASVCVDCERQLPLIRAAEACGRCGAPVGRGPCGECGGVAFAFDASRSVGTMEAPLSRILTVYKDAGDIALADPLGRWLAEAGEGWRAWAEAVTWVPARREATLKRGFDHAELLARRAACELAVPVVRGLLAQGRTDQRGLGRSGRTQNMAASFLAADEPLPARLLLVDDVFTTGSTLDAASLVLKGSGTTSVRALTVARVCRPRGAGP